LYTGRDFVIIDFEGEPARPLAERRAKHVSMVDVAGMIRSFHYAAYVALRQQAGQGLSEEPSATQEESVSQWYHAARTAFLEGYDGLAATALFWPPVPEERDLLLDVHLIDKALYELSYELNNRPAWVGVPLRGILQLVEPEESPIFK
jgi:trehalose synthase-fused probable maltokinase